MNHKTHARRWSLAFAAAALATGCLDRPVSEPETKLESGVRFALVNSAIDAVDVLFEIDNSNSMRDNQTQLAAQFAVLIDQLVNPQLDPVTHRPTHPPVRSLHVGVISSDLGTPGSTVPSCANSDVGDDGLLNPIRNGQALRTHEPFNGPPGVRPARCTSDPNQYPSFLSFTADTTDPAAFRDDFVCNAFLSTGGCGLEQQLESAYRALVVHNPREQAGNTDPNAGFVRDNAVLAIVILSDEEDGSTRDCRYAERDASGRPVACHDAISVFDSASQAWSSADLNLRFYNYAPGSAQDPTWPIDRYIDPARPNRGFLSLKPNHPDQVVFAAITGVPIELPTRPGSTNVDWDTLLGRSADGSDGYTAMSNEGPISMRQRNMDPSCANRVVPACRREGTSHDPAHPACDTNAQYFAWPSRRLAQVARRFDETYQNGTVSSICRQSYEGALDQIVARISQRLTRRCLPHMLQTATPVCCDANNLPHGCAQLPSCTVPNAVAVQCQVRETLPSTVDPRQWCVAAHGRRFAGRVEGRDTCVIEQIAVTPGGRPGAGAHGFYYDTSAYPPAPECSPRVALTDGDSIPAGGMAEVDCVEQTASSR